MAAELKALSDVLVAPERPVVAVVGVQKYRPSLRFLKIWYKKQTP